MPTMKNRIEPAMGSTSSLSGGNATNVNPGNALLNSLNPFAQPDAQQIAVGMKRKQDQEKKHKQK